MIEIDTFQQQITQSLPMIMLWVLKLMAFLIIIWVAKFFGRVIFNKLENITLLERLKVEGVINIASIVYYTILFTGVYIGFLFLNIEVLNPIAAYIFTNIALLLGIVLFVFGLAWALNSNSQEQANRIVTNFAKKVHSILHDPSKK